MYHSIIHLTKLNILEIVESTKLHVILRRQHTVVTEASKANFICFNMKHLTLHCQKISLNTSGNNFFKAEIVLLK